MVSMTVNARFQVLKKGSRSQACLVQYSVFCISTNPGFGGDITNSLGAGLAQFVPPFSVPPCTGGVLCSSFLRS